MSTDTLNIATETNAIIRKLGLEPSHVRQLTITPHELTAEIFTLNADGKKHTVPRQQWLPAMDDDDTNTTGFAVEVATHTKTYKIRT